LVHDVYTSELQKIHKSILDLIEDEKLDEFIISNFFERVSWKKVTALTSIVMVSVYIILPFLGEPNTTASFPDFKQNSTVVDSNRKTNHQIVDTLKSNPIPSYESSQSSIDSKTPVCLCNSGIELSPNDIEADYAVVVSSVELSEIGIAGLKDLKKELIGKYPRSNYGITKNAACLYVDVKPSLNAAKKLANCIICGDQSLRSQRGSKAIVIPFNAITEYRKKQFNKPITPNLNILKLPSETLNTKLNIPQPTKLSPLSSTKSTNSK
jgi:hypothetical protein